MKSILTTSIFLVMLLAFTSSEAWDPKGLEKDVAKGQEAIDALGVISGDNVKVDVLNEIFSRFCVGK